MFDGSHETPDVDVLPRGSSAPEEGSPVTARPLTVPDRAGVLAHATGIVLKVWQELDSPRDRGGTLTPEVDSLLRSAVPEGGMDAVRVFISPGVIDGETWLRPCFTNFRTERDDVHTMFAVARELGAKLCPDHRARDVQTRHDGVSG
jgi:hypothetical protein